MPPETVTVPNRNGAATVFRLNHNQQSNMNKHVTTALVVIAGLLIGVALNGAWVGYKASQVAEPTGA